VAFIGTGLMGAPIANRFLLAGFPLTVHNRTKHKAQALLDAGARWADTPAAAAAGCAIVFTCVPDAAAIEAVLFGPGGVCEATGVSAVVDLSTSGPDGAARIAAALADRGIGFVDAPVTGGTPRARDGTLTVITSGRPETIDFVRPALATFGTNIFVVGPTPGQAQTVKLINNMLNYLAMMATSEAMVFGVKAGIDPAMVLQVLNTGTGKNSATEVKFPKVVLPRTFNYGSTNRTVDKDLSLFLRQADDLHVPTPITSHMVQLWRTWLPEHADEDMTTIVQMFEKWSGVEVGKR
jgi:3-hydroxyisobutyrate dehydrogenase-like beta-hydroxyacid dehydrogenase